MGLHVLKIFFGFLMKAERTSLCKKIVQLHNHLLNQTYFVWNMLKYQISIGDTLHIFWTIQSPSQLVAQL